MRTPLAIQKLRTMSTEELAALFDRAQADRDMPLQVLLWISGEYDRRARARANH